MNRRESLVNTLSHLRARSRLAGAANAGENGFDKRLVK